MFTTTTSRRCTAFLAVLLVAAAVVTVWVRFRAGQWQAWVIGVPVLVALGLTVSDDIAALLPNML